MARLMTGPTPAPTRIPISGVVNWLHRYNWHRPHSSSKANTPIGRHGLSGDNLLRLHG